MGSVRGLSEIHHLNLDGAIGHQRSSLRPSSARCSFSRSARFQDERSCRESPGPAVYDYPSALRSARSAVMGTAHSARSSRPSQDRHTGSRDRVQEPDTSVPDSGRGIGSKFRAPPRPTFGYAARGGQVMDTEFRRACPDHGYGADGPGFVYSPDHESVRPKSAPSYTIPGRKEAGTRTRSSTPAKVAPGSYPGARENAIGPQRTSQRRSASASTFGRADRFAAPKPASGGVTDECMDPRSDFGDPRNGTRASGRHASFGYASREGTAHAGISRGPGDRPVSSGLGSRRLPHPPVAPRQELLRYGDNLDKHI